jgi:hypothetical protein
LEDDAVEVVGTLSDAILERQEQDYESETSESEASESEASALGSKASDAESEPNLADDLVDINAIAVAG